MFARLFIDRRRSPRGLRLALWSDDGERSQVGGFSGRRFAHEVVDCPVVGCEITLGEVKPGLIDGKLVDGEVSCAKKVLLQAG